MRLFRRVSRCERHGHDYGPFMRSHPVCVRCGYVDPPPLCIFCRQGRYTEPEPIMGALCCDNCGRSIMDSPGSLPSFDNAGTIALTDGQHARIMGAKGRAGE